MRLKKLVAVILSVVILAICFVVPAFAASASVSSQGMSNGTAKFSFTISASEGVGAAEFSLSASGGSITGATASAGTLAPNGGFYNWYADNAVPSVTITVTCAGSGPVTLSYSGLAVYNDNADPLSGASASGSATATPPATTAAPTAAPKTTASTAANLKSLSVKGYTLSPKFSQSRTSYTVTVPKDLTSLDVSATALNGDSNVTITGDKNFTAGKSNTIKIAVKAADGTTKTYTIKTAFEEVTTAAAAPQLTALTVNGLQKVNIAFKPGVYQYNIVVPLGTTALDIKAEGVEGAEVTVVGADDLVASKNKVVVTITSADGQKTDYTLNVTYASEAPVPTEEKSSGAPIWLVIILSLLFLVIGFVIGFIIGKKRGESYGDDGDDNNDGSGFYFGANADDENPAPVAPASTGFNFSGMSFNPAPSPEPVAPPEESVPLNAPVYTNPVPAAPVVPTPVAAPAPAYVAPPAAAPATAPVPPVAPVVPAAPAAPANQDPVYVAPSLPYQPGATLTDENVVQPAPKTIAKNPFEQCADD